MDDHEHQIRGADSATDDLPKPDERRYRPAPRGISMLPLRVGKTLVRGALSAGQISEIATRFDLPVEAVKLLSGSLGAALEVRLAPHLPVDEAASRKAGKKNVKEVMTLLSKTRRSLDEAKELVQELEPVSGLRLAHDALAQRFIGRVGVLAEVVAGLERLGRHLGGDEDLVEAIKLVNAGKTEDSVRQHVMGIIFAAWERQGRKTSFTTDPQTSQRRGVIFDFVNAVLVCITEPSRPLSNDTIVKELQIWRKGSFRKISGWYAEQMAERATLTPPPGAVMLGP